MASSFDNHAKSQGPVKKPKRIKSTYTAKTALATLADLRQKYIANNRGHQRRLREILQHAQGVLARLRKNDELRRVFLKRLAKKRKGKTKHVGELNLATEVMTKVTGNSRRGRKYAWKYGKVLDVLAEQGVPVAETAKAIKFHGGIEKLIGGAKPDPRDRSKNAKSGEPIKGRDHPRQSSQPRNNNNDQEVLCGVYIRMSDRDRILDLPAGTSLKLEVLRIAQRNAELKVRRIFDLPSSEADDEEDED